MADWLRLKLGRTPRPLDGQSALYVAEDGTLTLRDSEGTDTEVGGATGGSQTWTELFNSDDLANLDDCTAAGGGIWTLGAGGVISQTDDTDDDDTEKTLVFDWATIMTKEVVAGLTGIAVSCEVRADMAPGANEFRVYGYKGASVNLGLISSGADMVVYEDFTTVVPQGTWSVQSQATTALATFAVADGAIPYDGGGAGGVPRSLGVTAGNDSTPAVAEVLAFVGGASVASSSSPLGLLTYNGKGSFRKFRLLGLYGLPDLPA